VRPSEIDVILLDMIMPGDGWVETLHGLQALSPRARIILTSGYSGAREARRALEEGAAAFIGKPYTIDDLARILKVVRSSGRGEAAASDPSRRVS
jgi:DNA-binding NarL/FixJ family response regulator